MFKPYYQDKFCTIYHGDCLEIMPELEPVDFVFSDPPYNENKNYLTYKDNLPEDQYWEWVSRFLNAYKSISNNNMAIFISSKRVRQYWNLISDAHLIVVRKGALGTPGPAYYRQYFCLLSTAKPKMQIYDLWWNIRMPGEGYFFKEPRYPNPGLTGLNLTKRAINYFTEAGQVVFDGFVGTGTTLLAAKQLNRKAIGIEIEEKYCEIAVNRLAQEVIEFK